MERRIASFEGRAPPLRRTIRPNLRKLFINEKRGIALQERLARAAARGARILRNKKRWRRYRMKRRRMYRKHAIRGRWFKAGSAISSIPSSGYKKYPKWYRRRYRNWKYNPPKRTERWTLVNIPRMINKMRMMAERKLILQVYGTEGEDDVSSYKFYTKLPKIPSTLQTLEQAGAPATYTDFAAKVATQALWSRIYRIYGKITIGMNDSLSAPNADPILARIIVLKCWNIAVDPTNFANNVFKTTYVNSGYQKNYKAWLKYQYGATIKIDKLIRLTEENNDIGIYSFSLPVYYANSPSNSVTWAWNGQYSNYQILAWIGQPSYYTTESSASAEPYVVVSGNITCFPIFKYMPVIGSNNYIPVSNSLESKDTTSSSSNSSSSSSEVSSVADLQA